MWAARLWHAVCICLSEMKTEVGMKNTMSLCLMILIIFLLLATPLSAYKQYKEYNKKCIGCSRCHVAKLDLPKGRSFIYLDINIKNLTKNTNDLYCYLNLISNEVP